MNQTELSQILYALKRIFGKKRALRLFEKLIKLIYS